MATPQAAEAAFRDSSGKATATLVRLFGDIDSAEEAVQDAFVTALEKWPEDGIPPSPSGWIITTAKRRAIDRFRREATRDRRQTEAMYILGDESEPDGADVVGDDRLRLIFTCCHPALGEEARVALTLRLLGGLQTPNIARAFLIPEPTLAQRLVRAKRKIKAANIPYRVPDMAELPNRLGSVLAVLYLIFNEGHTATEGDSLARPDLAREAIRLARSLADLMPDEPEVKGLLALMLLTEARRPARVDGNGRAVTLEDQDRDQWVSPMIEEGHDLVRACLRRNRPGPYQIQAAINAVHTDSPSAADTDWRQIVALYDQLLAVAPSPVVELNRAIAVAELDGVVRGLELVDQIGLDDYYLSHTTRGVFLQRLGRDTESETAYLRALALTRNRAEQDLLERRIQSIRKDATS